jgi:hypothetical protein
VTATHIRRRFWITGDTTSVDGWVTPTRTPPGASYAHPCIIFLWQGFVTGESRISPARLQFYRGFWVKDKTLKKVAINSNSLFFFLSRCCSYQWWLSWLVSALPLVSFALHLSPEQQSPPKSSIHSRETTAASYVNGTPPSHSKMLFFWKCSVMLYKVTPELLIKSTVCYSLVHGRNNLPD